MVWSPIHTAKNKCKIKNIKYNKKTYDLCVKMYRNLRIL